ncbi:MAG: hypothetical protein Edafosvirus17_7 [Edafosvirus sp.]|uniref:Uncharacterized protein n=1 Tax=Edafosvirus sp. TaxID=2487765 RepID=A0A3G4ZX10_9VIRU|nr:MAG: hypothetical protein Edafosvirus17_7 [Edafosvirus sp.]
MSQETKTESEYVDCYNCKGEPVSVCCPRFSCELCETYGDKWGKLLKEYSKTPVTITTSSGTRTYTPPSYSCLWCKDTKQIERKIYDTVIANKQPRFSDGNDHLMPRVTVACFKCLPEESAKQFLEEKKKYFGSRLDDLKASE